MQVTINFLLRSVVRLIIFVLSFFCFFLICTDDEGEPELGHSSTIKSDSRPESDSVENMLGEYENEVFSCDPDALYGDDENEGFCCNH